MLRAYLDIFVVVYLDDILVFSKDFKEHIQHVRIVLEYLEKAGLRLKPEKCEFYKEEVEFLKHIVERYKVKISLKKIKVVKNWPTLKNVKNI